ncbi:STAS domain-containing protein [Beijerinckia indica]|uniref:MlaB-like STAS domain-containing protein n=1 Tax=Beijerinckia indica subsp. indica (strain ATCC 9039 / DSM 1715 / NCIMB 8712) TaxID=395963 RepID=B2IGA0_BEII9|nr:STAS domain-containing protein [Beijerinckia indica]ACB97174.1 hypothetical protein Bind_3621 [Beijerinckia indica subsp. indica ATCC 9039]
MDHPLDSALSATIDLPAILDLRAATPLASELLGCRGRDLIIDAAKVQRIGGQCLQVLLSAVATWQADEIPLSIRNPSPDFLEAVELLGIRPAALLEPASVDAARRDAVLLDKDLSA